MMMSASDSPPTAAQAGVLSAPRPNPNGQSQNGAGLGATPSASTSTSALPSTTPGTHPIPANHSFAPTDRPINGLNNSSTSTPIITHSKSPPAQIVSTPVQGSVINSASGTDTGKPSPATRISVGFPSPNSEATQTNQKFLDDCGRLKSSLQQSLPEAIRRSVRDNWEACLLGSPFHQAFVLNASIHHATPAAIQRGMHDFGKTLISKAKTAIFEQMTTGDLDELADLILSKASVAFYDNCLEQRLKTIDAKRLINALARAGRLGYELDDVQEEDEEEDKGHTPQTQYQPPAGPSSALLTPAQALHCGVCFRRFPAQSAYDYHVSHKVCTRSPTSPGGFKYNCLHCAQGFTTLMGLQYHNSNKVCGDFGEPITAYLLKKPHVPTPFSGAQSHTPVPVPSIPSHMMQRLSPATPSTSKTISPASIPPSTKTPDSTSDPYAHLSPEQVAALQSELREAEVAFIERMRQAMLVVDPAEKKAKVDGFSNSFSTKQSLLRKKYGVRLRQRRNKTEFQQERDRVHYKTASEIQAEMGMANAGPGRTPGSITAVPAPKIATSTNASMHGSGKRQFSGGSGVEMPDSKRVAYADMGGLSGANLAEAETTDPTISKGGPGTKEEPMALDDSESESSGSDSDTADEDIPAELPASVKQTLVRSSPASVDRGSRAASSSALAGV